MKQSIKRNKKLQQKHCKISAQRIAQAKLSVAKLKELKNFFMEISIEYGKNCRQKLAHIKKFKIINLHKQQKALLHFV